MSFRFDGNAQIHTKRLLLRKFDLSDIDSMLRNWISDPDVQSGYGEPVLTTRPEVVNLLDIWRHQYRWAIILADSGENIGHVSFCRLYEEVGVAEVEFCVGKAFWGKGIVTEALCAFVKHTFLNTSISKLEAFHLAKNISSGRVLQKVGFHPTPTILRFSRLSAPPEEAVCYGMTRLQFAEKFLT